MRFSLLALVFLFVFLFCGDLQSQIRADFSISKNAGCSPLVVSFKDASSGISPDAEYEWDFGNGNRSRMIEPGAVYTETGTYTVTLTVTDGTKTYTQSKQVTVYKKPEADFSVSISKGCAPLPVVFQADAKPGDGTLSSFSWDFGDGNTTTTSTATANHTFNNEQLVSASLTVTNSFGCHTTIEKKDIVNVLPILKPDFKSDQNFICKIDDPIRLNNLTVGTGQLTYSWDFGDDKTSTDKDPVHVFNKQGVFTVKLTAVSSEGCTATETKTNVLNVASFKTDFNVPPVVCQNAFYSFRNLSTPVSDSYTWFVDGMQTYWQPRDALNFGFNTYGKHKIRLENKFGICIDAVEKEIDVRAPLKLEGFVAELKDRCTYPAQYILKDTTAGAVGWSWNSNGNWSDDKKEVLASFYYSGLNWVSLRVKDNAGCIAEINKPIEVKMPSATIRVKDRNYYDILPICKKGEVKFYVETDEKIVSYEWDFPGTTFTSTLQEPTILYDKPGTYQATVSMKTEEGCVIKIQSRFNIVVKNPVTADFSVDNQTICGNTPAKFTARISSPPEFSDQDVFYSIIYGDGYYHYASPRYPEAVHQYPDTGVYTVQMVVRNSACSDTITKVNYVRVLPSFPRIFSVGNTCEGDRGTVTLKYEVGLAASGTWDFGDGTTAPVDVNSNTATHQYKGSGNLKIFLSVSNGTCTNKDSIVVYVRKKQSPILSAVKPFVCRNMEELEMRLSNLDTNVIRAGAYNWIEKMENKNGTNLNPRISTKGETDSTVDFIAQNFDWNSNDSVRLIILSTNLNCRDTSNWIPLKVGGPSAAARMEYPCNLNKTVIFHDISTWTDKIVLREWSFGDNTTLVPAGVGPVTHTYAYAGGYDVKFSVIDEKGCNSWVYVYAYTNTKTVKASFTASSTIVSPGTNVNFINNSTSYQAGTTYTWLFGDGTSSNQRDASKIYTQPGSYTVKLIALNSTDNCPDTATQTIVVKFINAAFNINKTFITASKCPPVSVQFNNTSSNISRISWNFGDGVTSTVFNPSHIYTKTGTYIVTMNAYSDNGTEYRTIDTVKILAPFAQIFADSLTGCTNQRTKFKASAQNALNYTWDFGDGSISTSSDSLTSYNYRSSGVFRPKLIVTDLNGCSVPANLKDSVVIDSLSLRLTGLPSQICVPRAVEFNSIANTAVAGQMLDYKWDFGTVNGDGSDLAKPTFSYSQTGKYFVQLTVKTSFGCVKTVGQEIIANQGLGAIINGPAEICQGAEASFAASTAIQGSPKWTWIFPDGSTSSLQNPAPLKLQQAGDYQVKLIADNAGCTDTLTRSLIVNATPTSILSAKSLQICKGSPASLSAQGGISYRWSPPTGLAIDTGATITAIPQQNTSYVVSVTSAKGCIAKDSVSVTVVQKQKVSLAPEMKICSGNAVQLQASGTDRYNWVGNTSGLSSTTVGNPIARPAATTSYKVVGGDAAGCFTDSATVNVIVNASPTVDAGPGAEISVGGSYQLTPTASPDVTKYLWSPDRNLSCVNCASPVASPTETVTYTLKVSNENGCSATDTVTVEVMCTESKVYIPNIFTPNGDGKNELFSIKGAGIKLVKSFRIFDRWGQKIFEKTNFQINDPGSAWNGRVNGVAVPPGSYIYMAELSCDGKTFSRKGTVTVIY